MTFRWNEAEVSRLLQEPGGAVYDHIEEITRRTLAEARTLCPHKTGRTAASLQMRMEANARQVRGTVWSDDPVVRYLEQGTGLWGPEHRVITPVRARVMGPIGAPYPRFLRSQQGMRPQPFLRRALSNASPYPVVYTGFE